MNHLPSFLSLLLSTMLLTACFEKSKSPAAEKAAEVAAPQPTPEPSSAEKTPPQVSTEEAKHRYGLIEIEAHAIHYTIVQFDDTKRVHKVVKRVDDFNPQADQENAASFNSPEARRSNLVNKLNHVLRNNESLRPERIHVVYYDDNSPEVKAILALLPSHYKVQKVSSTSRLSTAQCVEQLRKEPRYNSQLP